MLTREEREALREGLESAGLRGHVAEAIAGYAVPSLELSAAASGAVPVGATKIGGLPDLPEGTAWPGRSGRVRKFTLEPKLGAMPMAFLAQVDLAEATGALRVDENPLPSSGLLSFFYDAYDRPWGFEPEGGGDFLVIHTGTAEGLAPAAPPEDLPEACRFAEWAVSLVRKPSLPGSNTDEVWRLGLTDEEHESYWAFCDTHRINPCKMFDGNGLHQLLGYPDAVQDDDMELQCELVSRGIDPEAYWAPIRAGSDPPSHLGALADSAKSSWRLMLQLDSDSESGMQWGDIGMLYFWVTERGLRERNFDDVWVVLQTT